MALLLLTTLSRIPFRSHILYHWDSVNFANGLRHMDVLAEHPHPPGYIVYVWLGRAAQLLAGEANAALVWISIVAGALSVVMLYLLGRSMWNERVGLYAALFLAASPLFWFYGQIALPHALDTLLVLAALWLLYRVRHGETVLLWPAVLVLALAGGVRQQTLVFLLPVALYAVWRVGWGRLAAAGVLGAVACLAWLLPLMAGAGGMGLYMAKMDSYSARFQDTTSVLMGAGWAGVEYNVRRLIIYTAYGLGLAMVPMAVYGARRMLRWRWPGRVDRLMFLALWVGPALVFYALIHMGQQGLVLIFMPALLLLAGVALDRLLSPRAAAAAVMVVVVVQALFYGLGPEYPLGAGGQRLLTRQTLTRSDAYYAGRFEAIRQMFPPEEALIIAANWEHVRYYLPEYRVLAFGPAQGWGPVDDGRFKGAMGADVHLVVFDPVLAPYNASASMVRHLPLPDGQWLEYLKAGAGQHVYIDGSSFGVSAR
jgi:4-amino-4-deoxy-L-arabinose transferase-like glycosyltransferase